jgi:hypothetical protein
MLMTRQYRLNHQHPHKSRAEPNWHNACITLSLCLFPENRGDAGGLVSAFASP